MKQLLALAAIAVVYSLPGCAFNDCCTTRHFDGTLLTTEGTPINGWIGVTEDKKDPDKFFGPIAHPEKVEGPEGAWGGLTHTGQDGQFELGYNSGITWSYVTLFGFIPLGSTTPPEVPILDHAFVHIHDEHGWHTICVSLRPEQQSKRKPGERWVAFGRIVVE